MRIVRLAQRALALALLFQAGAAFAQEEPRQPMFIGELRSITLTRRDDAIPTRVDPATHEQVLVISNSCGTETATFRVMRSTSPMASPQTFSLHIGEWCRPPAPWETQHWLVIPGGGSEGEPLIFPIVVSNGESSAFAFVENERLIPESLRGRLGTESLPHPVEYQSYVDARSRDVVRAQPSLQIRNGKIWIVRGIPLSRLFPDLSIHDLN